ncbi:MAG: hypothetical protein LBN10_01120 [Propionibacteriaceae bacterium]|jgi:hypothetical protein|nr:hypothetical protein [Propionibacteriaceae bacterium]
MSSRPDWRVLETRDPIPGNAPEITDASDEYERIRRAIDAADVALKKVIHQGFTADMVSASVDEVRKTAKVIDDALSGIAPRYSVAATELSTYAEELLRAQTVADEAEREAQNAQAASEQALADKHSAESRRNAVQTHINSLQSTLASQRAHLDKLENYSGGSSGAPADWEIDQARRNVRNTESALASACESRTNAQQEIGIAQAAITAAQDRMDSARLSLHQALTGRDDAARNATQAIRAQIDNDGLNDTWWDNWGSKVEAFLWSLVTGFWDAVLKLIDGLVELFWALVTLLEAFDALFHGDYDTFWEKLYSGYTHYLDAISKIASAISTICGTLAMIFAFIPGLQGVAGILKEISTIAGLVDLAAKGALALLVGLVEGNWDLMGDFLVEALFTVLTEVAISALGSISEGIKSGSGTPPVSGTGTKGITAQNTGQGMNWAKETGKDLWGKFKDPLAGINSGMFKPGGGTAPLSNLGEAFVENLFGKGKTATTGKELSEWRAEYDLHVLFAGTPVQTKVPTTSITPIHPIWC